MAWRPIVFMFSGQGSQHPHMGRALFMHDPVFRETMLRMDEQVIARGGHSIVEALYSHSLHVSDPFDRIKLTHPAIFMVEFALAAALQRFDIVPDKVLGVSLGSLIGAAAAAMIDRDAALAAVQRHADVLERTCRPGGMIAILSDLAWYEDDFVRSRCELAAVNSASHFVVAGEAQSLKDVEVYLKERNVLHVRLPVGFAFHSRWIEPAREGFESELAPQSVRAGRVPLVCCQSTETLRELPQDYFWSVARNRIRFGETIAQLEREGGHCYIDLSPGGSLSTLLKYILPATTKSSVHSVLSPFGRDLENLRTLVAIQSTHALAR